MITRSKAADPTPVGGAGVFGPVQTSGLRNDTTACVAGPFLHTPKGKHLSSGRNSQCGGGITDTLFFRPAHAGN